MKRGLPILFCCFLLASLPARAQFYSAGTDPGGVRWSSVRTENYRVIYPRGVDSLARAYALSLQQQYPRVGRSAGYAPSELCRTPMSVILHPFTSYGNGMVMWAPRRMELYTVGDPGDPDPTPWMLNLTTHEQRHAAQLQFGRRLPYGALRWFVGDLSDVAWWAAFTGIAFSEGDAVVAETGLTPFGRGRTADFLEYVRVAFDEGDWRDYYRWRYGSQRHYTPDHYRAGYMLSAGLRAFWDEPLFLKEYQDNLFGRRLPLLNMQYTIRQVTGEPTVKKAFGAVSRDFQAVWESNDAFRGTGGAFVSDAALTAPGRRYTAFRGAAAVGDDIYAVKTGLEQSARLVRIGPEGTVHVLRPFAPGASDLRHAGGRLYWSEERRDPRWELAGTSVVRTMDLASGRITTLLGTSRAVSPSRAGRFYNPAPSEDGTRVAAMAYDWDGGHRVLVIHADGTLLREYSAPAGLQPVQGAWIGDRLFVCAVTGEGFGIYEVSALWRAVLPGRAVKVKQLRSHGGRLWFVCDKDGANELYSCDPASGALYQETSLRHGGTDFVWNAAGDTLRYTVLSTAGRMFRTAPVSAFTPAASDWDTRWEDPVAGKLSAQERTLEAADTAVYGLPSVSDPKPYRKAAHLLHFHTWAPLYVDYDAVSSMSFSTLYRAATLGATAFFQNDLATAKGSIGYSARRNGPKDWRHLLDLRFNYTGWYPVIEASLKVGGNAPSRYQFVHITRPVDPASPGEDVVSATLLSVPSVSFSARVYIPLVFNGGGWNRGFIPQVRYSLSNSLYDGHVYLAQRFGTFEARDRSLVLTGMDPGATVFLQNVTASVRGYVMLPTAPSGVYPRWGIGAEAGAGFRPALTQIYDPAAYGYVYGYVPGAVPEHGVKLTGVVQRFWTGDASRVSGAGSGASGTGSGSGSGVSGTVRPGAYIAEQRVTTYPRGYAASGSVLGRYIADRYPTQMKWTVDYLAAILPVDWSGLGPVAYVKNFELGLHGDAALYLPSPRMQGTSTGTNNAQSVSAAVLQDIGGNDSGPKRGRPCTLMSAGASLSVRLGNLVWVPFDTRIGATWSCNFGPSYDAFRADGLPLRRHYVGFLFSIDY